MGTTLTGLTPATTYDALIKVGDNGPLSATAKYVGDGLGNDSVVALSTSSVGIGTTSPTQLLHVAGNVRITGALYDGNNAAGTSGQILSSTGTGTDWIDVSSLGVVDGSGTANYVSKWSDPNTLTNSVIYDNGTNVGIGTNTPQAVLHTQNLSAGINTHLQLSHENNYAAGAKMSWFAGNNVLEVNRIENELTTDATTSGMLKFFSYTAAGGLTEKMRITGAGNVGIGTSSPLQTSANRVVTTINGTTSAILNLGVSGNVASYYYADASGSTLEAIGTNTISALGANIIQLTTNGSERLRITSAGNVGIGTSAPDAAHKLDVNGKIRATDDITMAQTNPVISYDNGSTGALRFVSASTSSERMRITSAGNVGIGTTSPAFKLEVNGNAYCTDLSLPAAGGIYFDSGASKYLDDYEIGTWTMGVSFGGASVGVTYGNNTGTYTKIGRQVTVNGYLSLTSKGSSTGVARITGLPFTIPNSVGNFSVASVLLVSISFANQFQAYGVINTTTINLEEVTESGTPSALTDADFANTVELMVSFTYFV